MRSLVITGEAARLKWGYLDAASLSAWSVEPDQTGGVRLAATVVQMDAFRASQHPLTFVVPRPSTTWRWPIQSLQIADGRLTADLGPQEM